METESIYDAQSHQKPVSKQDMQKVMDRSARYFLMDEPPYGCAKGPLIVKFDGFYYYWGEFAKRWELDNSLWKTHWIDGQLTSITVEEATKLMEEREHVFNR